MSCLIFVERKLRKVIQSKRDKEREKEGGRDGEGGGEGKREMVGEGAIQTTKKILLTDYLN